jgi:MHS family proline/betaine transporter-like MFS transporter
MELSLPHHAAVQSPTDGILPTGNASEGAGGYRKVMLTAVLGNVVEWYDSALYGILAVYMAIVFFPSYDTTTALLATYAGFVVSYAIRPLGGVVMGRLSDIRGHKSVLMLTINLMTFGTVAIGLLPSYASIGIWAPIMLVLCRLVQGVGASGEYTVAANYMLEHGPPDRRQYLAGWSVGSTSLGPLLASVVVLGLAASIGREGFEAGGWRIPFLLAAPLGLTTLYMRKHTRDLPRIEKALAKVAEGAPAAVPSMTALRDHWRSMVQVILLGAGQRVGSFCIQTYFVTALITKGSGRSAPCSRRSCAT